MYRVIGQSISNRGTLPPPAACAKHGARVDEREQQASNRNGRFKLISSATTTTITEQKIITTTATDILDPVRTSGESDIVPPYVQLPTPTVDILPSVFRHREILLPLSINVPHVSTLDVVAGAPALESLIERYGQVSHGGILDKSYSFFMTRARDAALSFKAKDKIAVLGGDPLCELELYSKLFAEFKEYRKQHGWGIAVFSGSTQLLKYASQQKWVTMRFGTERVLNPMTNPVLQEKVQKQIIRQNKQLLDPKERRLNPRGVQS